MAAPYEIPEFAVSASDVGPTLAVVVGLTAYLAGLVVWYAVQSIQALRKDHAEPAEFDADEMAARFASRNARRQWRS